jgi:hypothetical protein
VTHGQHSTMSTALYPFQIQLQQPRQKFFLRQVRRPVVGVVVVEFIVARASQVRRSLPRLVRVRFSSLPAPSFFAQG